MRRVTLEVFDPQPGDVIAVFVEQRISVEQAEGMKAFLRKAFPDNETLIFPPNVSVDLVRADITEVVLARWRKEAVA